MKTAHKNNFKVIFSGTFVILLSATFACTFGSVAATPAAAPTIDQPPTAMPTPKLSTPKAVTTPTAPPAPECLAGIQAGVTTKEQTLKILGQPAGSEQVEDFENLLYPSALPSQFNTVLVQNNVVIRVDRVIASNAPLKFSEVKKQYGVAPHTAYSTYQHWAKIYLYPAKGVAFIANENQDAVFVQQCFALTTFETYQSLWSNELLTADPFTK